MFTTIDVGSHATIHPSHSEFDNACIDNSNREYMVQRFKNDHMLRDGTAVNDPSSSSQRVFSMSSGKLF